MLEAILYFSLFEDIWFLSRFFFFNLIFVSLSPERGASSGSMFLDGTQGGFLDMVDFHNFLQDVLETGALDIGMWLHVVLELILFIEIVINCYQFLFDLISSL